MGKIIKKLTRKISKKTELKVNEKIMMFIELLNDIDVDFNDFKKMYEEVYDVHICDENLKKLHEIYKNCINKEHNDTEDDIKKFINILSNIN